MIDAMADVGFIDLDYTSGSIVPVGVFRIIIDASIIRTAINGGVDSVETNDAAYTIVLDGDCAIIGTVVNRSINAIPSYPCCVQIFPVNGARIDTVG